MTELQNQFIRSTRHGYKRAATGAFSYLKGIWLQFSRGLLFVIWLMVPILLSTPFGLINETIQALAAVALFLLVPVFWGYIDLYHIQSEENQEQ